MRLARHRGTTPGTRCVCTVVVQDPGHGRHSSRGPSPACAQSYRVWELLVVNDGGDPSVVDAVVAAAANDDRRVRVLHRPSSLGMEDASNAGLAAAAGRYVTLLDDDDTWDTTFLATCVAHLAHHGRHRCAAWSRMPCA